MNELLFGTKEKKRGEEEAKNRAENGRSEADVSSVSFRRRAWSRKVSAGSAWLESRLGPGSTRFTGVLFRGTGNCQIRGGHEKNASEIIGYGIRYRLPLPALRLRPGST